jgi:hypothetical protein
VGEVPAHLAMSERSKPRRRNGAPHQLPCNQGHRFTSESPHRLFGIPDLYSKKIFRPIAVGKIQKIHAAKAILLICLMRRIAPLLDT